MGEGVPAERGSGSAPSPAHEAILAAALVLGAAALRWVRWERTAVLFNDGIDEHTVAIESRRAINCYAA